jgi:predicted signal transduction protein with EAL and GGDEF domain
MDVPIHSAAIRLRRLTGFADLRNLNLVATLFAGLILPECSLQQAAVRAEEIRTRLKELHSERASEIPGVIAVSIGVAAFEETTDKGNLLLKFADDALYQTKRAGRDRVVVARPAADAARLAATPT